MLTEDEIWTMVAAQTWYVQGNDLVGGWCITNVPKAPSQLDWRQNEFGIADFVLKGAAAHIVALHNKGVIDG